MSKSNPIKVKYHSCKVEFALRGAAHVHGVLWIDWENFDAMSKDKVDLIKSALEKMKNEKKLGPDEKGALAQFADNFVTCSFKDPKTEHIIRSVNIHHHTKTCRKYGPTCRFHFPRFPA